MGILTLSSCTWNRFLALSCSKVLSSMPAVLASGSGTAKVKLVKGFLGQSFPFASFGRQLSCTHQYILYHQFPGFLNSKKNINDKENIILMGSPGSGKTTVGQLLGAKMKRPVIDVDNDCLEKLWNMPVTEKLQCVGSERFIEEEGNALRTLEASGSIISLTGSNPMHQEGMDHINKSGVVVYLDVPDSDILQRLERMEVKRIVGQEAGIPMADILKYRQQFYEGKYDIRIICEAGEGPESIMDKVMEALHLRDNHEGYVSTREDIAKSSPRSFSEALLEGLAWDGGLYVPYDNFPTLTPNEWLRLVPLSYPERALRILEKWLHPNDVHPSVLGQMVRQAYPADSFGGTKAFPLERLYKDSLSRNQFVLELFHGPTASFKDAALQLLPMFFQHALTKTNSDEKYLILVATSGDTGGAVLRSFGQQIDNATMKLMVLFPENGISPIQKAQMTSMAGRNIRVLGVNSDFDFCQTAIKTIFNDHSFSAALKKDYNCRLSAANSVNWGRLLPQVVYHCSAYLDLVRNKSIMMGQPVDYCIPTGNFGNILAAYYAQRMRLPIRHLITASNANNVLTEFVNTGCYTLRGRTLLPTSSPAIDILKSSNLERLLYHLSYGDHSKVRGYYKQLEEEGRFVMSREDFRHVQRTFKGDWCTEDTCLSCIKETFQNTGYLLDPHTAVAKVVADKFHDGNVPMVIASTAHYAKFAPSVLGALGQSAVEQDARKQFEALEALGAKPGLHQSLLEGISRPRVHNKVLDANLEHIVREVRDFVDSP